METTLVVIFVGVLIFLAHLFAAVFEKTRIPDVLPLVLLGLILGPVSGLVSPEALGKVGVVFTTISLVIILFEGGLGLELADLKESSAIGLRLTLINFFATLILVAAVSMLALGLSGLESLMLGAILGGTSSAVVIPMLGELKLETRSSTTLFLESSVSDVLCIIVTLALIQAAGIGGLQPGRMVGQILASFILASALGAGAGMFWSTMLHRIRRIENSLFTTPAFVSIVYGITELLGYSGAIAALAFGVALGNVAKLPASLSSKFKTITLNDGEIRVFGDMVFLLKTFFFVFIGLSIRLTDWRLLMVGMSITLGLFLIRVPIVRLVLPADTRRFDALISSVMVPKGLAAAVLASMPLQAGLANGAAIQDIVYTIILFSIVGTAVLTFLAGKNKLNASYGLLLAGFPAKDAK